MRPSATSCVLWFALVLRSVAAVVGVSDLCDDPDSYRRLAINWSQSGVFGFESPTRATVNPTAYRPPLYPWLLSWMVGQHAIRPLSIAALHIALGVVTVWLTISISRALRQPFPWLAGLAVAVDPLLLRASQLVMTETLAALLIVAAWRLWLVVWPIAGAQASVASPAPSISQARSVTQWLSLAGLGVVWGLAILARPTAAPWVAVCVVGGLFCLSCSWKRRAQDFLLLSLLVACTIGPWTLRNYRTFGKPIWATTHGGYTLLLANNPLLFDHFAANGPARNWNAEPFHAAWARRGQESELTPADRGYWLATSRAGEADVAMEELADDRLAYSAAWATIARQPGMFLLSCVYRLLWLWALWPNLGSLLVRLLIGSWYAVWYVMAIPAAAIGGRRIGVRASLLPLALVLSLSAVHAVYWSNMRMRGPAMPAVYVAAVEVIGRLSRRKPATTAADDRSPQPEPPEPEGA